MFDQLSQLELRESYRPNGLGIDGEHLQHRICSTAPTESANADPNRRLYFSHFTLSGVLLKTPVTNR